MVGRYDTYQSSTEETGPGSFLCAHNFPAGQAVVDEGML